MEPKREVTSVDLRALCLELDQIAGEARLDKAYLYGDDFVRLKLRDFDLGRIELLIEVGDRKRINRAPPEYVADAPDRPPNFARMLRNRLSGARLVGVEQYEFDRIARLDFERDEERVSVIAEFFGDGNVAVVDETDTVIDSLRTIRLKSRTVAPGATYEFPDVRVYPFELDRSTFGARLLDSSTDVVRTLATQLNLGGTYAEEICTRAGVDGELAIGTIDESTIDQLHRAMADLGDLIAEGSFDPVIVHEDDHVVDVSPFPLTIHEAYAIERWDTMNTAVAEYFYRLSTDDPMDDSTDRPDFEAEIAKYDRMISQQRDAIEGFDVDEAEMRAKAEALYAHYDLVDEILSTVQAAREDGLDWNEIRERIETGAKEGLTAAEAVQDISTDGTISVHVDDFTVELDSQQNVERNANSLYQEAKRIKEKRRGAEEALAESRAERTRIEERKAAWSPAGETGQDSTPEQPQDWLSASSIPVRTSDAWFERFRWFHTSDDFLVIGGRNADQNEELVDKYMEPGDRFVHAQAHGGPVTVLKATDPSEPAREVSIPDRSIEQAAQFAISYASVWKTGQYAGDAYVVSPDQVSKEAESGEYLQKGAFVVRGERRYLKNLPAEIAIGIACEPVTRVIGGPPAAIEPRAAYSITVEPGDIAQSDVAMRLYRQFREAFTDTTFVRKVASADRIQEFLPPGRSRITEDL